MERDEHHEHVRREQGAPDSGTAATGTPIPGPAGAGIHGRERETTGHGPAVTPASAATPAGVTPASAATPASGAAHTPAGAPAPPRTPGGIASLSLPSRIVVAVVTAVVAVAAAVHLGMMFLHVAPANTVSKQHGEVIDDYVYPEFEQNWKLFAPNPLQQNVAVQARAEVVAADGGVSVTSWTDLSALDGAEIHHSLVPSHTRQNELRRAWDFFVGSHDEENRPNGLRGELSERYVKRIVLSRIGPATEGGTVRRIQVRSATTPVAPPAWSDEKVDRKTVHRELDWWPVDAGDVPGDPASGTAAKVDES
ncbi:DUF5819 family protein [Streptomyces lycii]|uniref:DUF5819 family protein n=1 Tax=Streptomyces lycii TaxID=2654337 RepID=UPI001F174670|nr:DUF5819 family protein [Streptomyces lycii]